MYVEDGSRRNTLLIYEIFICYTSVVCRISVSPKPAGEIDYNGAHALSKRCARREIVSNLKSSDLLLYLQLIFFPAHLLADLSRVLPVFRIHLFQFDRGATGCHSECLRQVHESENVQECRTLLM